MMVLMIGLSIVLFARCIITVVTLCIVPPRSFYLRIGENPPLIVWTNFISELILCAVIFGIIGLHVRNAFRVTVVRKAKASVKDTVNFSARGYSVVDEETGLVVPERYQV